jgi:hypothetical protein
MEQSTQATFLLNKYIFDQPTNQPTSKGIQVTQKRPHTSMDEIGRVGIFERHTRHRQISISIPNQSLLVSRTENRARNYGTGMTRILDNENGSRRRMVLCTCALPSIINRSFDQQRGVEVEFVAIDFFLALASVEGEDLYHNLNLHA